MVFSGIPPALTTASIYDAASMNTNEAVHPLAIIIKVVVSDPLKKANLNELLFKFPRFEIVQNTPAEFIENEHFVRGSQKTFPARFLCSAG